MNHKLWTTLVLALLMVNLATSVPVAVQGVDDPQILNLQAIAEMDAVYSYLTEVLRENGFDEVCLE